MGLLASAGWALLCLAGQSARAQDEFQGLAEGPGQEETYFACSACHSIHLVKQQRLSPERWDKTLTLMVDKQGMPEPDPDERALILEYLVTYYGRDVPR
jgi:hypothetical protein